MKKSLLTSNKYLRDPTTRKAIVFRNAVVSARIEGVRNAGKIAGDLMNGRLTVSRNGKVKPAKNNGGHRRIVSR